VFGETPSVCLAVREVTPKVLPASCRQIVLSRIVSLCRQDAGSTLSRFNCIDAAWYWGKQFGASLPTFVAPSIQDGPMAEGTAAL
jgi:hypothetical protein